MNIKCPRCDFENEEGSKFCKNCNEPLVKFNIPNAIENPYIKSEEVKVKNKIEKEEKIQTEVGTKIENNNKKKISSGMGCLIFLVLAIILGLYIYKSSLSMIDLNASVDLSETQCRIKNNDNFDWLNVIMEINKSGFIFKTDRIKAGEVYIVEYLEFAKKDGTRFDPLVYKLLKFNISCDTPKGESGFWSGSLK